ncbi:unnamed protein product [Moneuplotes crassus]|uniref:Uncharacterized protein n=1 Tax=Euplotes crassus TaxID=5936 RepID=A0AAD1XDA4_EUPCR|nr:unnamed protein product [Moneuplotes crassus]
MESMTEAIEEKKAKTISLEKSFLVKTRKQDRACFDSILWSYLRKRIGDILDSEEFLFEEYPEFIGFSRSLNHIRFIDIGCIMFIFFKSKNKHLVDFFEFSFPNKTNMLSLWNNHGFNLNRSNYFNSLLRLSSKVVHEVRLMFFSIRLPQLKKLMAAFKHVKVMRFDSCELSIPDVPNLSKALKNCQIQELDLSEDEDSDVYFLRDNFDQFKNLVQGLASSPDLSLSLKTVNIAMSEVNQNEAEQLFKENQLGDVKIIGGI